MRKERNLWLSIYALLSPGPGGNETSGKKTWISGTLCFFSADAWPWGACKRAEQVEICLWKFPQGELARGTKMSGEMTASPLNWARTESSLPADRILLQFPRIPGTNWEKEANWVSWGLEAGRGLGVSCPEDAHLRSPQAVPALRYCVQGIGKPLAPAPSHLDKAR